MTIEIAIVLVIIVIAVILFATERLPVDLVALVILALLLVADIFLPGPILSVDEAFMGFSNPATVTVASMFVLSGAILRTGSVNFIGEILSRMIKRNFYLALISILLFVSITSGFINNTPVVAVFIPIIIGATAGLKVSASKLLMPMSFAAMLGGTITLIGTSTNILVSSIATQYGLEPLRMFEFAKLGIIFLIVGIIYLLLIGVKLIPVRLTDESLSDDSLVENYRMGDYLTDVRLVKGAKSIGKRIVESPLVKDLDIDILTLFRDNKEYPVPLAETVLEEGDILRVRSKVDRIKDLMAWQGLQIMRGSYHDGEEIMPEEETMMLEAVIAPNSQLSGRTLRDINFRERFGATALAIRQSGHVRREQLTDIILRPGDTLLIETRKRRLEQLKANPNFVFISVIVLPEYRKSKALIVLSIIVGVILTASLGWVPIVSSAVIGCILLVLFQCINMTEVYESIEWKVIFLLAGVLSLGFAMENTGAAQLLAETMIYSVGDYGPTVLVASFYLVTTVLTNIMSNNATAALMTPIAITASQTMDVNPMPLLMSVAFAASAAFMTPVGYQTNTLIYGPGKYTFADFLRVGTPLNIILFLVATFLIPKLWAF